MTVDGVMAVILHYFTKTGLWGPVTSQWLKLCLQQKCRPKNVSFRQCLFLVIYAAVTEKMHERRLHAVYSENSNDARLCRHVSNS